jgi:hypothetical protein
MDNILNRKDYVTGRDGGKTMKNIRKTSGHPDKTKKKISTPSKDRVKTKVNDDEVCFVSNVVLREEPACCCDVKCC